MIHTGDCREIANKIKAGTVDLVLTDPPYGTVKGANLDCWDGQTTDWDDALKPDTLFDISDRLLRCGGRAVLFSQEPYTADLITNSTTNLPFSYRMIWEKNVHANALNAKDAPVNLYEDITIFTKKHDSNQIHPLRSYFANLYGFINATKGEIIESVGERADHCFRFNSPQFSLCTIETYRALQEKYKIDRLECFKSYEELERADHRFKQSTEPTFNLAKNERSKSNILKYAKPNDGKHPTQKPVPLLVDLIQTFSNPGDLVVDLTAGSGSTCVAADRTERRFIGIEKDETYAEIARTRIGEQPENPQLLRDHAKQSGLESFGKDHIPQQTP